MKKIKYTSLVVLVLIFILRYPVATPTQSTNATPELWPVRSVDTMKTSRDLARQKLYDATYDSSIQNQLNQIKSLGANYVAIGTPYDEEFTPYLYRWVSLARKTGLRIWFRGNWSNWEGWFDYPKNMTPDIHLQKTADFIVAHPDLFQNSDAFDPCPECENAGFWPQPEGDSEFNKFVQDQQAVSKKSFSQIHKNVHTNWSSIIGGRAKEVLDKKSVTALENIVTIDHYVTSPSVMTEYLIYFSKKFNAKTLVGEFGAPIPDINGEMAEATQAAYIRDIFKELYINKDTILGVNYYVLSHGTSELFNPNGSPRLAAETVKNFFIPGSIKGTLYNTAGDQLANLSFKTGDGLTSNADSDGKYVVALPAGKTKLIFGGGVYKQSEINFTVSRGQAIEKDVFLEPTTADSLYTLRLFLKQAAKILPSQ